LEALFGSDDESSSQKRISPKKGDQRIAENMNEASSAETPSLLRNLAEKEQEDFENNLTQNLKKRGRKKKDSNKISESNTRKSRGRRVSVYDLDSNQKYKVPNKDLTKAELKERYQDIIYVHHRLERISRLSE